MWRIRSFLSVIWMVGVMLATFPFAICSRAAARFSMARFWAAGTLRVAGVRLRLEPARPDWPAEPVLLVSNHASLLDIPVLCATFRRPPRFVAKLELGKVPLLGYYMRRSGAVLVDRKNPREAVRTLERVAEHVREGNPYCFFAEGTRADDGFVHRFRNGAFQVAMKAGVPVLPVAIVGSGEAQPPSAWVPRAAEVRVAVGELLRAEEGEAVAHFAARARDAVGALHRSVGGKGLSE